MLYYKFDILEALKEKEYTSYRIRKEKIFGEATLTKFRQGVVVSSEVLDKLCELLKCQPGDILEYVDDEKGEV